ncbi:hypothetical protein G7068_05105 [Leucobacter viscericola]|uniref:Uncharacterized protein n=1 Tax=Leucobacter viscericola TaxID=2714935 RepID=A0A6G7XDV9_9MICO|nr:hypothetical protein [Leucobacter viscericola]QIK62656.1 hypothetical protein G7068_05105 [Leucobacter viscericola]
MALTEGPIRGRAKELSTAMELLRARSSIDILGVRMSGRSTFLREIGKRLDSIGVDHLLLSGVTSLRSHNFGTLMAAGIFPHYDKSIPVTRAIDALAGQLGDGHTAILVDNWDAMDELSKGVIRVVSDRKGTPIARTRLKSPAFTAQTQPEFPPTIEPSLLIEVKPVSAEDLDLILRDYLGAPIDPATTARILSKSGGIVGLALKLTESAVAAKRIVLEGGVWKAQRNLWNSGLYTIVEELLAGLSKEARGALEVLALSGASELGTAKDLVHWDMLEELEAHSLIKIYAARGRYLITISPPLVVEYFRRSPVSLRRIRHDDFIVKSLGLAEAPAVLGSARQANPESDAERDAVFARIVREQEESRSLDIAEAWRQSPTAKNRVEYARSLARMDAAPVTSRLRSLGVKQTRHRYRGRRPKRPCSCSFGPNGRPVCSTTLRGLFATSKRVVKSWVSMAGALTPTRSSSKPISERCQQISKHACGSPPTSARRSPTHFSAPWRSCCRSPGGTRKPQKPTSSYRSPVSRRMILCSASSSLVTGECRRRMQSRSADLNDPSPASTLFVAARTQRFSRGFSSQTANSMRLVAS